MPYRSAFGRKRLKTYIRDWRKFRNLSQEKLAEIVGTSPANLSRIESAEQDYTQSMLEAIAAALDTDAATLLRRRPGDNDDIWPVWERATPAQRVQITEIAKTI